METITNKFKSMYKTSIFFSIILIILGIFLLINASTTLIAISYVLGIFLIIYGLIPIIKYFINKDNKNYLEASFVLGVFFSLFGIIIMIKPTIISSIIPLLIGIWMLINGGIKLYYALTINKKTDSVSSIVISSLILLCGILLVCNPFSGAVLMTRIVAIFLIIYSVLDLVECFSLNKKVTDMSEVIEENNKVVIDGEYKEKKKKNQNK